MAVTTAAVSSTRVNRTEEWLREYTTTCDLADLTDPERPDTECVIAVEASHYLQNLIDHPSTNEPLLSALGGFPLALKKHVESDLAQWTQAKLRPLFVFDGLTTIDREEKELQSAKDATVLTNKAWSLYTDNLATEAVRAFGHSGAIKAKRFVHFFQEILEKREFEYIVAPYSACAQIAYLVNLEDTEPHYVDGALGSSELLLFDIPTMMTKISFEEKKFHYIDRNLLVNYHLKTDKDKFVDALLCTGMYGIPPFPPLVEGTTLPHDQRGYSVKDAGLTIKSSGLTVGKMCETLMDKRTYPHWEEQYQKAKMSIKHMIVRLRDGTFEVTKWNQLTRDNYEYLGLQLPEELMYYLTTAAIAPRILSWLASSLQMLVHPPLDGGDSAEYKTLVSQQLVPIRQQTVALLASKLHNAFQHKELTMKFWYDGSKPITFKASQVTPKPADLAKTWLVKESEYKGIKSSAGAKPGTIFFALRTISDSGFAASTTEKIPDTKKMSTADEIVCNTLWRFFHLRGYINDKHELTIWGKALSAALEKAGPASKLEEAIVLAFELIRYDQLNTRNLYEDWIGGALRGSDDDIADCLLFARLACLAKLQHKPIGYTGPLSRNLLAFHSITTAVRESDRDLIETIWVNILLHYEANRDDWPYAAISLRLPFWNDVDCALGIAVKTYLDDFAAPNQSEDEKKQKKQEYAESLIPHNVDFAADLEMAFDLFDSVCAGVKTLNDEVPDKSRWERAQQFLTARR